MARLCRDGMNYANREIRELPSCCLEKSRTRHAMCHSPFVLSIIVRDNCVRESFDRFPKFDSYDAAYDFLPSLNQEPNGVVSKSSNRNVSEIRSVSRKGIAIIVDSARRCANHERFEIVSVRNA